MLLNDDRSSFASGFQLIITLDQLRQKAQKVTSMNKLKMRCYLWTGD